ncbi:hypothetical protein Clacol_005809 [Clathrus columnatus]|uniref:Aminotransferase class I/classII large domain-containing protein n=1 Tax=Clathrus columnatus TaxID=1419009 RepID=A0AAV5AFW3_9AGAM|nr:hypothetical protein Clacol_005809 [Clathrus columnatus]
MSGEKIPSLPNSIDLSHHLSSLAKARVLSPLKRLQKIKPKPGTISMSGGHPDPTLFPIENLHIDALLSNSFATKNGKNSSFLEWIWSKIGTRASPKTETYTVNKFGVKSEDIDLAHALQYSGAGGMIQLQEFAREFTKTVYTPAYGDWTILADCGNTDATSRCLATFCNPGDSIIVEEWTYPSFLASARPMGVKPVPVKVDGQGMMAIDLERILSTWDENVQGRRPRTMYTVPIGQNPTGAFRYIFSLYSALIVCETDIIIIEDDPYYFLQEGIYVPKSLRCAKTRTQNEDDPTVFIKSLTPSYLKAEFSVWTVSPSWIDINIMGYCTWFPDGLADVQPIVRRTIGEARRDGYSITLWFLAVTKQWGMEKYIRWLQGLQGEYTLRRDFVVDKIHELFDVSPAIGVKATFGAGLPVMTAYLKEPVSSTMEKYQATNSKTPLFSFIPPTAGMFLWIKFHIGQNIILKPGETLVEHIFVNLAEEGLLISPGAMFSVDESTIPEQEVAFRIAFSKGTQEEMSEGLKVLERVMREYSRV